MEPLEAVIHYHDRTKHHPQRYARSLGHLDWATQPDPFRRFTGAELIPLPPLLGDDTPPYAWIFEPGRIAPSRVDPVSLSRFFECALALSAWKEFQGTRWALRVNPSSGNLHPTEGYLVIGPAAGVGAAAGVYHYAPREHALERRTTIDAGLWPNLTRSLPEGAFLVGLSSVLWREAWKYGERAFRYCQHDVGHALGALRIAAAMQGWRLVVLEALGDSDVARLLGLDRTADFVGAEAEHPDLIAAVFADKHGGPVPAGLDAGAIDQATRGSWSGRANALSAGHVEWEIIDQVAEATSKPRTAVPATARSPETRPTEPARSPSGVVVASSVSARQIVRQRRSAVAYDGVTAMEAATFYAMLGRVMPQASTLGRRAVPWDALAWSPRIHLLLFVHRVLPLAPGLYLLIRDSDQTDRLRKLMKPDFVWQRADGSPEELPLYLLQKADCRRAAAQLSLGQEIAGDSAFSLGMLADFENSLREFGPWFYRRLFWEAGMVGQVLYLEAEAAGLRATGIGAYFDDWVHDVAGLTGRAFQSLYHFTVGGPVEDGRLTTLPAYAWSIDPVPV
jgi:SagB-type dehydrogenase family enzyme